MISCTAWCLDGSNIQINWSSTWAHMAQHGHTWHNMGTHGMISAHSWSHMSQLVNAMITLCTTFSCTWSHMAQYSGTHTAQHNHTWHNSCTHTAQHNHKWNHMGTNESPFAMSCTLSLQWLQVVPWIWSVSNALQDHVQTHKQAQKAWAHSHCHMGSPCCMTWWQKLGPAQSSEPLDGSTLDIMQTILHMFSPGCVLLDLRQLVFHIKHLKSMLAPVGEVVPPPSHATHFADRPTCIFIPVAPRCRGVAPRLAA